MKISIDKKTLQKAIFAILLVYVFYGIVQHRELIFAKYTWSTAIKQIFACACIIAIQLINSKRLQLLLKQSRHSIDYKTCIKLAFAGMFVNSAFPAGIGYDLLRYMYMKSKSTIGSATSTSIIIFDRYIGLFSLTASAVVSILAFNEEFPQYSQPSLLYSLVALFVALVLFPIFISITPTNYLFRSLSSSRYSEILQKIFMFIATSKGYRPGYKTSVGSFFLALASHILSISGIGMIASNYYDKFATLACTLLTPLVLLASCLPISPSNIGWTEAVAQTTYIAVGVSGGFVIFLTWRALNILVSLIGAKHYLQLQHIMNIVSQTPK